jgi:NTP pyrophosphatase (non-canonical NTP hydrolase)
MTKKQEELYDILIAISVVAKLLAEETAKEAKETKEA